MPTTFTSWPTTLHLGADTPAFSAGHTLVLDFDVDHLAGHVLEAVAHPADRIDPEERLRAAADQLGYGTWSTERYRDPEDGLDYLDVWEPAVTPERRLSLINAPTGPGTILLGYRDTGPQITFTTPDHNARRGTGSKLTVGIPDFTPDPVPGVVAGGAYWDPVDRDRWLAWAGLTPA